MKKNILIILFLLIHMIVFSLFRTPEAGRHYYWLFSPELLSKSMGVGGTDNPAGLVINPASQAFIQRYKIEASYGVAPGFLSDAYNISGESFNDAADFFWPFIVNAGCIIPSKFGNFSIYANYMNLSNYGFNFTDNNDLGIGKVGALYFGFSKDYSEHYALGISANIKFLYNPLLKVGVSAPQNYFDIAGGLDLGFIYRPGFFVPFAKNKDTRWGWQDFELAVTVKDLGKPFVYFPQQDSNDLNWFVNPFTPAVGFGVNLFNDGSTYWKIMGDFTAPFFQNVTLSLGTEIQIVQFLVLRASYTFDLEGVLEYTNVLNTYGYMYNLANVGFGMSFRFNSDFMKNKTKEEANKNRHKRTSFSIDIGGRPYHQGFIFEAGCVITIGVRDETPPEISFVQHDVYASPNLDGEQDEIVIDLDIKDERYIMYWKLEIYDSNNEVIRIIESKEQRSETMKVKDVLKKYFTPKSGIPIPKKIIWDGRDNNGNVVTDGEYSFKFFAMDDNKNINKEGSNVGKVVIDTEKPEIASEVTNTIFSPNDDGNKDNLIIDIDIIKNQVTTTIEEIDFNDAYRLQEVAVPEPVKEEVKEVVEITEGGERQQLWYVDILDSADKLVRRYEFDSKGKKQLEWDGRDEKNNKMPDGIYKVKLHSVDKAGNYWEEIITNIIINTEPTPISATILNRFFSPNGDGVNEVVDFKFDIPIKNGIESWKLEIITEKDKIVKTYTGSTISEMPENWDGMNEDGKQADEGEYSARLTVIYENGNMPDGDTPPFIIDVTKPDGKLAVSKKIFSPDGDGNSDDVSVTSSASDEVEWLGIIYNEQNEKVKQYIWKQSPPKSFVWDGKNNDNKLLDDGAYSFQLVCTDEAGNYFESDKATVTIFTKDTPVFITSSLESFSPNADSVKDEQILEIHAKLSEENKVKDWQVLVYDDADMEVVTFEATGNLPPVLKWDGKFSDGTAAPDGFYYATSVVNFEAGTSSSSKTKMFNLDTTPPEIQIAASKDVLSPNEDGFLDTFEILQKGSKEDLWEAKILSTAGTVVWNTYFEGMPAKKVIWDGRDMNGNILENGVYNYSISAVDRAGNVGIATLDKVEIKNVYTSAFVTLDDDKFSPNKDGAFDVLKFRPFVSVKEDLEIYKIEIFDEQNTVVKRFQGKESIPEEFSWDGLNDEGNVASDGVYGIKLAAIYKFGNRPEIESAKFILDTTPPEINVAYEPRYFSPDDDGNDDELAIALTSSDLIGIKNWELSIMSPSKKKVFTSYRGDGSPTNMIRWKGRSSDGELVESAEDYPVKIVAEDIVGNKLERYVDDIMVDILVEKLDDGRLKIKISNIQFKPNSPEMTDSPKNEKIIDLIARALKKYRQYNITIEGHANKFREGLDEELAKKLSLKRAETVSVKLTKKGIIAKRLTVLGRGFEVPLVELTPEAEKDELAKNRRVEFYLDKKLQN